MMRPSRRVFGVDPSVFVALVCAGFLLVCLGIPRPVLATPVYVDPYQGDDSTATAVAIAPDGSEFTGYCDVAGTDYLSFSAKRGKVYRVVVTTKGSGCWGYPGVFGASGELRAPVDLDANSNAFNGSSPETQSITLWAPCDGDETLFFGYTSMSSTPFHRSFNEDPDALIAYHVTVVECDRPIVRGRVSDPKSGEPVAGARVRLWCDPQNGAWQTWPVSWAGYATTETASDGTYSLSSPIPCSAWVYFDDPTGQRIGEYYDGSATFWHSAPSPGLTPLTLRVNESVDGVNGQLRQPGHLVVKAIRADTGEPVPGARFGLDCAVTDGPWADFTVLPDCGSDGECRVSALDPRRTYSVRRWDNPEAPSAARLAGLEFVDFVDPPSFTVSDGATNTIVARFELKPSDVTLSGPGVFVLPNEPFTLEGTLTWNGSSVAGQPVDIDVSSDGATWEFFRAVTTDSRGAFSLETTAGNTRIYLARYAGSHDAGPGCSYSAIARIATFGSQTYEGSSNTALTVAAPGVLGDVGAWEGNSIVATLSSAPTHGSVRLSASGGFTYIPDRSFEGADSFAFRGFHAGVYSEPATVTIEVGQGVALLGTHWVSARFTDRPVGQGARLTRLGERVSIEASLSTAGGEPLTHEAPRLQVSSDGATYRDASAVAEAIGGGLYRARYMAGPSAWLRFSYGGDTAHAASVSEPLRVQTMPALDPLTIKVRGTGRHASLSVNGRVGPVRTASASGARVVVYRHSLGRWVAAKKVSVPVSASGRFGLVLRVHKGRYRAEATVPSTRDHVAGGPVRSKRVTVR